jgi:hypothetical protein
MAETQADTSTGTRIITVALLVAAAVIHPLWIWRIALVIMLISAMENNMTISREKCQRVFPKTNRVLGKALFADF